MADQAACALRRSLPARWRLRRDRAPAQRQAHGSAGPGLRRREPPRRQWPHRARIRGQGRARRLHHPHGEPRAQRHQSGRLSQAALRRDQGLHADHPDLRGAAGRARAAEHAGEFDEGADCLRQGQSAEADLRLRRQWFGQPPGGRDDEVHGGFQDGPRSLQGRRAGPAGHHRGQRERDLPHGDRRHAADQERAAQAHRGHRSEAVFRAHRGAHWSRKAAFPTSRRIHGAA
jgi:hypothetical protein